MNTLTRRQMLVSTAAIAAATSRTAFSSISAATDFQFKYIVGACMYGYLYLGEILPEVAKCGATHIDIWPKSHGNQREQLDDMGEELFASLLQKHGVSLGCITQYKLGPFGLQNEVRVARRLGCQTIVTGGSGPRNLKGAELKKAVGDFLEKMKPHLEVAEETGVTIAIENHGNNLIDSPDSLKYLAELRTSENIGIALAPYHLPQDSGLIAQLVNDLGSAIKVFYAWEHGDGCSKRLPKEQELKQLPGHGPLDFGPIVQALVDTRYSGWTEIFMHPVPRGIPIMETAAQVTSEINKSRTYLSKQLSAIAGKQ
ncbi:MAG: sugar phosphate isomerase/epimerase [Fuerstiella sp.]|nr:sugar phosphate isomerase/epimerase [Fuerstiella sp.]MCP4859320.1 sugar phosphate isomerase/epimerase [Fuerstiella sp.]